MVYGVHTATQKDVVDAVRLVAQQLRYVHIHRGGTRRQSGRVSRCRRGDHRRDRGRRLDWSNAA